MTAKVVSKAVASITTMCPSDSREPSIDLIEVCGSSKRLFSNPTLTMKHTSDSIPVMINMQVASLPDNTSIAETPNQVKESICDACPFCLDTCGEPLCSTCLKKRGATTALRLRGNGEKQGGVGFFSSACDEKFYTICEVRRHNHVNSAWLLAGDTLYDATSYLRAHPGGVKSILRKSGGQADCTRDIQFHSKGAIRIWKQFRLGRVCKCPGELGAELDSLEDSASLDSFSGDQCVIC